MPPPTTPTPPPIPSPPIGGNDRPGGGTRPRITRPTRPAGGTTAPETINVLIPVVRSAQIIANAISQAETYETAPVAMFILEEPYIGAEISAEDLLALAEAEGTLILVNGRFSTSITYSQINGWDLDADSIITLVLELVSPDLTEIVSDSITLRDAMNAFWLEELHFLGVWIDEDEIDIATAPITMAVDVSDLNLSDEQQA